MLTGHFIPSNQGKLFITQFGGWASDTAILCLPSITEELNLSRAVIAKQAQAFANKGCPCFVLDYFGTGDSEGEFEQANCDIWLDNILTTGNWLQQQGVKKIILWGIRFGALLILAHQRKLHESLPIKQQLLWKPVTNGKQFAGQFLRIKQTSDMMKKSAEKVNWRQHILDGHDTEVAGYLVTAEMLVSMETLKVENEIQPISHIDWFELAANEPTPLTKKLTNNCPDNKITVHCFESPPFWQVPEIFTLPALYPLNTNLVTSEDLQ